MDFKEKEKESPKKNTLASEYKNMTQDREPYLSKAKEAAKYTIPSLIKDDNSGNQVQTMEQPNQSIGADGINNLSAKVTLAMLPPNQPFFKFSIDAADLKKIATDVGQEPNEFELSVTRGLSITEQLLVDYNEQNGDRICETYQMPRGAITALIAQISGAMLGKSAASWALKWFPGLGNAANASITYSLHEVQRRAIIAWCEANYKNTNIKDWDTAAKTLVLFRGANAMIGNPVDNYINAFGIEEGLSDFINSTK